MRKLRLAVSTILAVAAFGFTAMAGTWKKETRGWRYYERNGSYPKNCWKWIDGNLDGISECYYFDEDGYLLVDTVTPGGARVDANGAWLVGDRPRTRVGTLYKETPEVFPSKINTESWTVLNFNNKYISFDGNSYHIIASTIGFNYDPDSYVHIIDATNRSTYILDKNTVFDFRYTDPNVYIPDYHAGEAAFQWFTRLYNNGSLYLDNYFRVKISDNHIDAFTDITH